MKYNFHIGLSMVTLLFGLMVAIQYINIQEPEVIDARDINQLRVELKKEQELQVSIVKEIKKYEEQLTSYNNSYDDEHIQVLLETKEKLEEEIGMLETKGTGLEISISPMFSNTLLGQFAPSLSPELLIRLLNELKSLGAEEISVGNERIISTTGIREVNGRTMVNNLPISPLPLIIKIIATDPLKMKSALDVSFIQDDFAIENLSLDVSKANQVVTIPAYSRNINIKNIESNESKKGE